MKLGGMKEELSHRNSIISSLEGQLSEQKENMLRMGAELEFKDKVVHKIRAESEESIRYRVFLLANFQKCIWSIVTIYNRL